MSPSNPGGVFICPVPSITICCPYAESVAQLLAHPFRLRAGGCVTVTQDADSGNIDAVARIALTRQGELPRVPSYGIPEAAFDELSVAAINSTLATHGPQGVTVTADVVERQQRTERITLAIKREVV